MLHRFVKMTFRKEEIQNFKAIFASKQALIAGFEGCEKVNLLHDQQDERIFFTHSVWRSAKDLENYRNSPLFRTTWAATKVLFDDKPDAWSLEVVA